MKLNYIHNEDCLDTLSEIPDNSINLIITSPPYNKSYWSSNQNINNGFKTKSRFINYDGDFNDKLKPKKYIKWQKKVIKECIRVLTDDGSIFYNHIDILKNHNTIHPHFVYDFPVKQILIWNRLNTPKLDKSYFFPKNEYVFWIKKTKESKPKFYKNKCVFQKSIFTLIADKNNKHPAPFPLELPNNFILACSDKGDIVYDPFMGSGTTAVASVINKRNYIGSEISKKYAKVANKRIEQHKQQGTLW